jgi:hypothetical protein
LRYGWTPNPPPGCWPDSSAVTFGAGQHLAGVFICLFTEDVAAVISRMAGSSQFSSQVTAACVRGSMRCRLRLRWPA